MTQLTTLNNDLKNIQNTHLLNCYFWMSYNQHWILYYQLFKKAGYHKVFYKYYQFLLNLQHISEREVEELNIKNLTEVYNKNPYN